MRDRLNILLFLLFLYFVFIDPGLVSKIIISLDSNKLIAFGTLAAVTVALFGNQIRGTLFPSRIEIIDTWQNIQGNQGHTRLLFRNVGSTTALEVEAYVNRILDDGQPRQGFLPVPLIWTHTAGLETKRDFHPKQFGYFLDICRVENIEDANAEPRIPLIFGAGIPAYQNIFNGRTTLELVVSQKLGEIIMYDIELEWLRGQDRFVRVMDISRKSSNHF